MSFDKHESGVQVNDAGQVTHVKLDRHIVDPNDELAVQVTSDPAPPSPLQAIADAVLSEDDKSDEAPADEPPSE